MIIVCCCSDNIVVLYSGTLCISLVTYIKSIQVVVFSKVTPSLHISITCL